MDRDLKGRFLKGRTLTKEERENISIKLKEYYKTHKNSLYGTKFSEETRRKMSESKIEYFKTHESPIRGREIPQDVREKISVGLKEHYKTHKHHCAGIKQSEEIINKRVASVVARNKKYGHWSQINPITGADHHGAKKTKLELVGEEVMYFDTRKECAKFLAERFERPLKTIQNWIDKGVPRYMQEEIIDIVVGS